MKKRLTTYTFDASAKTILFDTAYEIEGFLLITNVVDNIIIYNFADATLGGTFTTKTLTLTYDTSLMSDTDELQIFYEDSTVNPSTAELQTILNNTVTTNDKTHLLLQQIRDAIAQRPDYVEASNTQAVSGEVTVTGTLTSVATLTNQTNIGGFSADLMTEDSSYDAWSGSVRNLII